MSSSSSAGFQFELSQSPSSQAEPMGILAAHQAELAKRNKLQPFRSSFKGLGVSSMGDVNRDDRRNRLYSLRPMERENGAVGSSKKERQDKIQKLRVNGRQAPSQQQASLQATATTPAAAAASSVAAIAAVAPQFSAAQLLVQNAQNLKPTSVPPALNLNGVSYSSSSSHSSGGYASRFSSSASSAAAHAAQRNPVEEEGSWCSSPTASSTTSASAAAAASAAVGHVAAKPTVRTSTLEEEGSWCSSPTASSTASASAAAAASAAASHVTAKPKSKATVRTSTLVQQKASLAAHMRQGQEQIQQRVKAQCRRMLERATRDLDAQGAAVYQAILGQMMAQMDQLDAAITVQGAAFSAASVKK